MEDKDYAIQIELYEGIVLIHFKCVYLKKIVVAVLIWDKVGEVIAKDVRNMEKVCLNNFNKPTIIYRTLQMNTDIYVHQQNLYYLHLEVMVVLYHQEV